MADAPLASTKVAATTAPKFARVACHPPFIPPNPSTVLRAGLGGERGLLRVGFLSGPPPTPIYGSRCPFCAHTWGLDGPILKNLPLKGGETPGGFFYYGSRYTADKRMRERGEEHFSFGASWSKPAATWYQTGHP